LTFLTSTTERIFSKSCAENFEANLLATVPGRVSLALGESQKSVETHFCVAKRGLEKVKSLKVGVSQLGFRATYPRMVIRG
jgi:hypothetical protein